MAGFQHDHPLAILLVALALALLSIWYTVENLEFQTSQMDLIYPSDRLVQLTREISTANDLDSFIVVIEAPDEARSLAFLHALVPALEKDTEHFSHIFFRVDPAHFRPWALLYLDDQDLAGLQRRLAEHQSLLDALAASPTLTTLLGEINREMASSMMGELFTGFLDDASRDEEIEPIDLGFLIRLLRAMQHHLDTPGGETSWWDSLFTGESFAEALNGNGYFRTGGKKDFLLLFVTPRATEAGFTDKLAALQRLRTRIAEVQADFPDTLVGVTGQEALNQDEMSVAFEDISLATIISLVGLALLLIIVWRGIRCPVLELVELVTALSLTFGLTTLFIGHLNILSVTFAPLLLGLGIDYGIHWLARYQEERRQLGRGREAAIQATMQRLGPSILLAGLTAAISFLPLVLTGFKGLVELGVIVSMGMVATVATTLCLLPALVTLFDATASPTPTAAGRPVRLFTIGTRSARLILPVAILTCVLALAGAKNITFDLNMLNLQSKGAKSVIWEHKLLDESDRSSMFGIVLADSPEQIRQKAEALEKLPTVSGTQNVLDMLPDNQENKLRMLREMGPLVTGIGPMHDGQNDGVDVAELDAILGRIRFKLAEGLGSAADTGANTLFARMQEAIELIDGLRRRFQGMPPTPLAASLAAFQDSLARQLQDGLAILRQNVSADPIEVGDLPEPLRERFILPDGRYVIRVFPSGDIWDPAVLNRFVGDMRSVDSDAIGDPVTLDIFTRAFRDGCIKAAVYSVLFVALLLLVTFRRPLMALLIMTPLFVGTVWTLGLMDVFGVRFNLANSLFLPLIVGAGVEYGIVILQRRRQEGFAGRETPLPTSTAKGVILAGLSTTIGFGSLTIAHHQGIASLGLLASIGSLCILSAALIFFPALLQVSSGYFRKNFNQGRD